MVVLVRVAAAGRSFYIPLLPFPASRILLLKNPAFVSPSASQNVLLRRKSVCRHPLLYCRDRRQPLSRVSRKQRYNTLDFPDGKSCANRDAARPYWKPSAKGGSPLEAPIFLAGGYPNCENAVWNACSENAKVSSHWRMVQAPFDAGTQK